MILQVRFGSAQAHLGYQFYDAAGALLGSRVTTGIVAAPETGTYLADATLPATAVGVYWNDTTTLATATEDLLVSAAFADATVDAPVVAPGPPSDAALCTVFVYTENLIDEKRAGLVISFQLSGSPSKSGSTELGHRVLETAAQTMTTDANGFASIALQRTDAITPTGRTYKVSCQELGLLNYELALTASTYNLATLIA